MSFFADKRINQVISVRAGRYNRRLIAGTAIIVIFVLFALAGPALAPDDTFKSDYGRSLRPPDAGHPFGTDLLGRDLFGRVAHGARVSLIVGLFSMAAALAIGLPLGTAAGYFGGGVNSVIMRLTDIFLAFPLVLGALVVMAVVGGGLANILIVLALLGWAYVARLARSAVVSIRESDFIEATRALGAGHFRIILRHVLPNAAAPVIIFTLLNIGTAILAESSLSFLGVGLKPPYVSWGYMLAESSGRLETAPWLVYFPGAALTLAVLGFTLTAEGLRAYLNPKEEDV